MHQIFILPYRSPQLPTAPAAATCSIGAGACAAAKVYEIVNRMKLIHFVLNRSSRKCKTSMTNNISNLLDGLCHLCLWVLDVLRLVQNHAAKADALWVCELLHVQAQRMVGCQNHINTNTTVRRQAALHAIIAEYVE